MSGMLKTTLILAGVLSALLIVSQLVMGLIIISKPPDVLTWVKAHQHSGYLTVTVSLLYVLGSLVTIASIPKRPKP